MTLERNCADLQATLLLNLEVPYQERRAISDVFSRQEQFDEVSKAFESNQPLKSLWDLSELGEDYNPAEQSFIKDALQALLAEDPSLTEDAKVTRAGLLKAAQRPLDKADEMSDQENKALIRLACSQVELQLADEYNYQACWENVRKVLEIDPNLKMLSGKEAGAFLANGLQLVSRLGSSTETIEFLTAAEIYLVNDLASIPLSYRVVILTRLEALKPIVDEDVLCKLLSFSAEARDDLASEQRQDHQNLSDNEQELVFLQTRNLLSDQPDFLEAKAEFKKRFERNDRFVESWVYLLLAEGVEYRDKGVLDEMFQILSSSKHEFLLAEVTVSVLEAWPEFFGSDEKRQAAVLSAWRVIEQAFGVNIMSLMSRCLDLADAADRVEGVLLASSPDFLRSAQAFLNELDDLPELVRSLYHGLLVSFGGNLKRIHTPIDLIRAATKAAFLQLHKEREERLFSQPNTEGALAEVLELESISVRQREAGDPEMTTSDSFILESRDEDFPRGLAQQITIPLDEKQVAVLKKRSLPLLTDSDLYWVAKFLKNEHAQDVSKLFSVNNTWESMIKPELEFEVLTPADLRQRKFDDLPWLVAFDEVHFKEANVDLIPDGTVFWVVARDAQTGVPFGFQALNAVSPDNYAFTVEGVNVGGDDDSCLAFLRGFVAVPDLEFEQILEVTNMGISFRFLQAEIMGYLFYHTADHLVKSPDYADWVVITIQAMLQRRYKAMGLVFKTFNPETRLDQDDVNRRIEANDKLGLAREQVWTGRGSSTRGGALYLPSALDSPDVNGFKKGI